MALHDWIREHAGTRFFLYVHLVDPHPPHRPRQEDKRLIHEKRKELKAKGVPWYKRIFVRL